jgi:hypothetical protein
MTRTKIDCRTMPSDANCTLTISGEPEEVLPVAAHHAVSSHGHAESPQMIDQLRGALADDTPTQAGAFVQLIDCQTERPDEWDAIVERWAKAIGEERTARWSMVGADCDVVGHFVGVVEFPDHASAMANSAHPATGRFLAELTRICTAPPTFRNLDVRHANSY